MYAMDQFYKLQLRARWSDIFYQNTLIIEGKKMLPNLRSFSVILKLSGLEINKFKCFSRQVVW